MSRLALLQTYKAYKKNPILRRFATGVAINAAQATSETTKNLSALLSSEGKVVSRALSIGDGRFCDLKLAPAAKIVANSCNALLGIDGVISGYKDGLAGEKSDVNEAAHAMIEGMVIKMTNAAAMSVQHGQEGKFIQATLEAAQAALSPPTFMRNLAFYASGRVAGQALGTLIASRDKKEEAGKALANSLTAHGKTSTEATELHPNESPSHRAPQKKIIKDQQR